MSQTFMVLSIHPTTEVQAKYSSMKNWLVTAVEYKIFQTNKEYINTWHMLPSVQSLAGHRRKKIILAPKLSVLFV